MFSNWLGELNMTKLSASILEQIEQLKRSKYSWIRMVIDQKRILLIFLLTVLYYEQEKTITMI